MIAKHPCVRTFLNGILWASHGFSRGNLCSGSWTTSMSFTIWLHWVPDSLTQGFGSPVQIFDRYHAASWEGEV